MRDRGQRVVARAARLPRLLVQARVVGAERGALRHVLEERQVRLRELAVGPRQAEGQHSQQAAAADQRQEHERANSRGADGAMAVGIRGDGGKRRLREVGEHHGLTGPERRRGR